MGSALYFVEGVEVVSPQLVDDVGLAYALAPGCNQRLATNGPGGAGGAVCSLSSDRMGFFADQQTWHDLGDRAGKRCWFGYRTGDRPGPDDLLRPNAISGETVTLFDDRAWSIPRAIAFQNGSMRLVSPASIKWREGKWTRGAVKEAYRRLEAIGLEFWNRFMVPIDDPAKALLATEVNEWAIEILGINYRVSRHEVSELELLADDRGETAIQILKAVIDFDGYLTHASFLDPSQKKSD